MLSHALAPSYSDTHPHVPTAADANTQGHLAHGQPMARPMATTMLMPVPRPTPMLMRMPKPMAVRTQSPCPGPCLWPTRVRTSRTWLLACPPMPNARQCLLERLLVWRVPASRQSHEPHMELWLTPWDVGYNQVGRGHVGHAAAGLSQAQGHGRSCPACSPLVRRLVLNC